MSMNLQPHHSIFPASIITIIIMICGCTGQTERLAITNPQDKTIVQSEELNASVNIGEQNERLMNAAWNGRLMEVLELLKSDIDPNLKGPAGISPLSLAAQNNHIGIVKELLENGADPNLQDDRSGWPPLMWASYNGFDEIVKLLLAHGADVNLQNDYGETSLLHAAFEGRDDTVRILLDNGADHTIQNDKGFDPMRAASNKGYFRIVKMLEKASSKSIDDAS